MELVPVIVNNEETLFPRGVCTHLPFARWEYSIDGAQYPFQEFINLCMYDALRTWEELTPQGLYPVRDEAPRYLCMLRFAAQIKFDNLSVRNLRERLTECFTEWIKDIDNINGYRLSRLRIVSHGWPGPSANHHHAEGCPRYPANSALVLVSAGCPACRDFYARVAPKVKSALVEKFRRDNHHMFRIRGFGEECMATLAGICIAATPTHMTVFTGGLGQLDLDELSLLLSG